MGYIDPRNEAVNNDPDFMGNLLRAYGVGTMGYPTTPISAPDPGNPMDIVVPGTPIHLNLRPTPQPISQPLFPYDVELPQYDTLVYGALSAMILIGVATLGRRWFNDYSARTNIKKEINKRFRFGDKPDDNGSGDR